MGTFGPDTIRDISGSYIPRINNDSSYGLLANYFSGSFRKKGSGAGTVALQSASPASDYGLEIDPSLVAPYDATDPSGKPAALSFPICLSY
jgi:hypothetical protein